MSDPARAGEGARQDHRPRAGECTAAGRECRAGGENRALRAEVSKQKGVVRELERELSEREELHTVRTKLTAEQALRKTAEVKLRTFNLEKARLVKQLRAAEADFESAEEALAKAQPAADLERELISMSERELERNCAAQVAAAHHRALAGIEAALDAELAKRLYFTPSQYVERARLQAASGHISSDLLKLAAVVMETQQGDGLITLPPANDSGRGRGLSYLQVVKHLKSSDVISPRRLYARSKELAARLEQTSAGGQVSPPPHSNPLPPTPTRPPGGSFLG